MSTRTEEERNDIRTNIIELLIRLYKKFEDRGEEIQLNYEKYALHYAPNEGLWMDGCLDEVSVTSFRYSSVLLGDKIKSYGHVPYSWIKGLMS
jgi:hypothetical protein